MLARERKASGGYPTQALSQKRLSKKYRLFPYTGGNSHTTRADHDHIPRRRQDGAPHRRTQHNGGFDLMKFFDSWWQRVPGRLQAGLLGLSIVGMVLGGMASEFWH